MPVFFRFLPVELIDLLVGIDGKVLRVLSKNSVLDRTRPSLSVSFVSS